MSRSHQRRRLPKAEKTNATFVAGRHRRWALSSTPEFPDLAPVLDYAGSLPVVAGTDTDIDTLAGSGVCVGVAVAGADTDTVETGTLGAAAAAAAAAVGVGVGAGAGAHAADGGVFRGDRDPVGRDVAGCKARPASDRPGSVHPLRFLRGRHAGACSVGVGCS